MNHIYIPPIFNEHLKKIVNLLQIFKNVST